MDRGEVVIEHKGTAELYANLLTKPLQGSQFVYERKCLTGWAQPEEKKIRVRFAEEEEKTGATV